MTPPLPARRRAQLLEILERDGGIQLEPAAEELDVSAMTVRRDIQALDDEGLVRRVRGGAVAPVLPRAFGERAATRASAKAAIARKARTLVPDVGAAAFDASTTSGALLSVIRPERMLIATETRSIMRRFCAGSPRGAVGAGGGRAREPHGQSGRAHCRAGRARDSSMTFSSPPPVRSTRRRAAWRSLLRRPRSSRPS